MYFTDWLRTVWANLNRMRGRVVLTAFGVVIGTMAVMVLVSLGAGLQRSATGSLGDIANLKRIEVTGAMMGQMAEPVAPSGKSPSSPEQEAARPDEHGPGRVARTSPALRLSSRSRKPQDAGLVYETDWRLGADHRRQPRDAGAVGPESRDRQHAV